MSETFGARLRRRREERGVDLITIAEKTKIKLSLLEALERDDVTHWPTGIFRRAFVRAYATAIAVDPEEAVREFLEVYPEPAEPEIPPVAPSGDEAERANAGPHARLRSFVGSAIGSLGRLRRSPPVPEAPPQASARPELVEMPAPEVDDVPAIAPVAAEPAPPRVVFAPVMPAVAAEPDLQSVAELCTQFGRVDDTNGVLRLLEKAAALLHATGVIVWVWDTSAAALKPALAHGYPERVVAQLPAVRRTADNPTAAAFRTAQVRAIAGGEHESGALAVPLITPAGCAGVLAIELEQGSGQAGWVRAVATIFAAMLAQLIAVPEPASVSEPASVQG